jgi:hypothetical protein
LAAATALISLGGCGQHPVDDAEPAAAGSDGVTSTTLASPDPVPASPPTGGSSPDLPVSTDLPRSTGSTAPVPWDVSALPPPASVASAPAGAASLTILLDDGFGVRSTWTLTCDPAGGTHPDPATACGVLGAHGATALPAVKPGTVCTEQYGGPQKAKITGSWRGKPVTSQLTLENGCEIARWTALLGLLPPGGVS